MTVAQRIYLHHLPHTQRSFIMKQIDFEHGKITDNILRASIPMLVAEVLSLLYNIVDRIYIARIPDVGTTALGAVGLCFPIITIILAFSNLFGSGGAPLFSIERGRKDTKEASMIMNTSFFLICVCALLLMAVGMIFAKPILLLFGSSENGLIYAYPYLMIYLLGTFPSMVSTGMNPFINAQGYATTGMFSVAIGAIANLILDPVFIFVFGLGIRGAAIATVLSQILSAAFVLYFLQKKTELKVRLLSGEEIRDCGRRAKNIISLGTAGFIMQLTNSLVTICCNNVLSVTGGDLYISVMTIVSSIRQIIDTPIHAITEGSSPVISYNYGARRPKRVFLAHHERDGDSVYTARLGRDPVCTAFPDRYLQFRPGADHRCDPGTETVLRSLCFSGTPVCGTDDVQVTGQEKIRDFLLSASQGHHRGSAYLHPSVSVPYGK